MKKILLIFAALVCGMMALNAQLIPEGTYYIRSYANRKYVVDLSGNVVKNGNNIQIWEFNGCNAQRWKVVHSNGAIILRSVTNNNYAIDLNGSNASNWNNIQLWEYNGTNAQRWYPEKRGDCYVLHSAVNKNFNLDLNRCNPTNGENIHCWEENNNAAQRWFFERIPDKSNTNKQTSTAQSTTTAQQEPTGHMKFKWHNRDIEICGKCEDFVKNFSEAGSHTRVIEYDENRKITTIEVTDPDDKSYDPATDTIAIYGTPKSDEVFMIVVVKWLPSYCLTWQDVKAEYLSAKKRLTRIYGNPIRQKERFVAPYSETNQPLEAFKIRKATYTCTFKVDNGEVMLMMAYSDKVPAPHIIMGEGHLDDIGWTLYEGESR